MEPPEEFLLCQGCLSRDRRCNLINENDFNTFLRILDPSGENEAGCQFLKSLVLCWECEATLRKFKTFQLKIQKAQNVLKNLYLPDIKIHCISTLKISTKTKYDADINTSLQLKEITITKIVRDLMPILDDTVEIKDEFHDANNTDLEVNIKIESPINFKNIYDDDFDIIDSDHLPDDDKPIIDLNLKNKVPKRKLYNKNKDEDSNPLFRRSNRLNKAADKFEIPLRKSELIDKGARVNKKKQIKDRHSCADDKVELPSSTSEKTCLIDDLPDFEEDDTKEGENDTTFIPLTSEKQKNIYNKKYTKLQIDKDNLQQYFTEYTLSQSEYKDVLQKLSKTWYFMNSKKKCAKCVVAFLHDEDYFMHMKLHDSTTGEFSCTLCKLYFSNEQQYHTHITSHLNVHVCNICKQSCGLQHSISNHIETVHNGFLYKCRTCGLLVETIAAMFKHVNMLHKRLVCNDCGKSYFKRNAMVRHARNRHLVAICPVCKVKFATYWGMRKHLSYAHDNTRNAEEKYNMEDKFCVECNKQYSSMGKFKMHVHDVHTRAKRRFPCPKCDKVLTKNSALNNHYNLFHGTGTKHRCEPCKKYYVTAFALRTHIKRVHQKIPLPKKEMCATCGRSFQTKTVLANHIRTHTGERPYECSHCDAAFAQKYARDVHVRRQHLKKKKSSLK